MLLIGLMPSKLTTHDHTVDCTAMLVWTYIFVINVTIYLLFMFAQCSQNARESMVNTEILRIRHLVLESEPKYKRKPLFALSI